MMETTIWTEIQRTIYVNHRENYRVLDIVFQVSNTYAYNGYPGYRYGVIPPPLFKDETVVTLAVPFAAGATAGLFVRPVELSVLGCTVGATAY